MLDSETSMPLPSQGTGATPPDRLPLTPPHASPARAVLAALETDDQLGLDAAQTDRLREQHGLNQLAEAPPIPTWRKMVAQFKDLVIWILIFAALLAGALGEWVDTIAILAIVLLNGVIGFFQEARAEQALAALQKLSAPMAKVFRGGSLMSLPAKELLPGDILQLEAGDNMPADARLLQAYRSRSVSLTFRRRPTCSG